MHVRPFDGVPWVPEPVLIFCQLFLFMLFTLVNFYRHVCKISESAIEPVQ